MKMPGSHEKCAIINLQQGFVRWRLGVDSHLRINFDVYTLIVQRATFCRTRTSLGDRSFTAVGQRL